MKILILSVIMMLFTGISLQAQNDSIQSIDLLNDLSSVNNKSMALLANWKHTLIFVPITGRQLLPLLVHLQPPCL